MRVKEEFKRLGYFWLPSDRDRKVPGILSISDGGIIKLEVLVPWNSQWVGFNENEVKRIVGRVEKDGPVTLDGCLRKTISADAKSGLSKSIFDVSKAFIGAAYGDEENPRFNTVKFSVERLDNWLGITGLEIEERIEDGKVTISYQPPAVLEMKLSNNMREYSHKDR